MQQLQHRDAIAVSLLMFEEASQLCLIEGANAVPQFGQRQLVVVRKWQFVAVCHGYLLPTSACSKTACAKFPVAVDGITARAAVPPARWVDGDWRNLGEAGRLAGDGEGAANQERPLRCTAVQLIDSRNSMASCDARTPSAMSTTGQIT